jgi:predicted translin family RNA/ssDNA-binding protein
MSETDNPYLPLFTHMQSTLDAHHLRRENIQKASRDITSSAKKLIFALHRLPLPEQESLQPHYGTVKKAILSASENMPAGELDRWRYKNQMSPGMQELVEGLLFEKWVMGIGVGNGKVMGWEETMAVVLSIVHAEDGQTEALLTWSDYILGLLDFTGEVMRYCITSIARDGHSDSSSMISEVSVQSDEVDSQPPYISGLETLREIHAQLSVLSPRYSPFGKEYNMKMEVLEGSIEKIENAVYSLAVRKAERTYLDHQQKQIDIE